MSIGERRDHSSYNLHTFRLTELHEICKIKLPRGNFSLMSSGRLVVFFFPFFPPGSREEPRTLKRIDHVCTQIISDDNFETAFLPVYSGI